GARASTASPRTETSASSPDGRRTRAARPLGRASRPLQETSLSTSQARPAKARSSRKSVKLDDITIVDRAVLKRAVGAMAFGNAMEWFDFGVYSYIAVTLGKVFFPSSSPSAQLLATFGTFAAAFIV